MSDKITLRLKSDTSVVLPEARLMAQYDDRYTLDFAHDASLDVAKVAFYKRDWEPVPPPYVLPTGIGAVVKDGQNMYWFRTETGFWLSNASYDPQSDAGLLHREGLTTLTEGIEP